MVIRSAAIMQARKHRVMIYLLRVGVAGCMLFVPATSLVVCWIAFGDSSAAISVRRARHAHKTA